jgi:hypothetical protein
MATPHVAGAAAILAQEHPDRKARQLKDALMSTSEQLSACTAYQVGSGRADLDAATTATVTATGSAYFGIDAWPHDGTSSVDRTVTHTNTGDSPAELSLALNVTVAGGPYDTDPTADKGKPAPEGMFTLSADTVTVPAHGRNAHRLRLDAAGYPVGGDPGHRAGNGALLAERAERVQAGIAAGP